VLAADIVRGAAYLDAGQSFYIKSYSYEGADCFCRIALSDVVHADPIAYLPGILPYACMKACAADDLFFLPVEDAEGVVEAQIELPTEYTDKTDTGFQRLWFLLYPGQPWAEMIDAAGDGLVKAGCIAGLVATEDESFRLYPVCSG